MLVCEALDLLELLDRARRTRDDRHIALHGKLTSRDFVTETVDGLRCWADPDQASLFHLLRKFIVLTEKAVTGVDEVDVCKEGLVSLSSKPCPGASMQLPHKTLLNAVTQDVNTHHAASQS